MAAVAAVVVDAVGDGEGDVVGVNVGDGAGAGLVSAAKAVPASPGADRSAAAKTAVRRACMTVLRD